MKALSMDSNTRLISISWWLLVDSMYIWSSRGTLLRSKWELVTPSLNLVSQFSIMRCFIGRKRISAMSSMFEGFLNRLMIEASFFIRSVGSRLRVKSTIQHHTLKQNDAFYLISCCISNTEVDIALEILIFHCFGVCLVHLDERWSYFVIDVQVRAISRWLKPPQNKVFLRNY